MPYQESRLQVFQELVECCYPLYFWTYDQDMNLLQSSCPHEDLSGGMTAMNAQWDKTIENLRQYRKPLVMSNEFGLMWICAAPTDQQQPDRIHALGPFFMYEVSAARIEAELRSRDLPGELIRPALQFLRRLPVIPLMRVMEYGVMLHYCLTGQRLSLEDVRFPDDQDVSIPEAELDSIHGTYENEKILLRLIREGDPSYKQHLQAMSTTGRVGDISDGTALRQLKNMILVNITLTSRAAMEGGLPPETAYTVSDRYFQAVEKTNSIQSIIDINSTMQEDFVQRVRRFRQNSSLSKPIRICVEQMHSRMEEDITLEQMAKEFGYSTYYLSRKFRAETGQSFKDHLRKIRLERAKFLLRNTGETILSISERLHFCSQSYFSDTFRKAYGISPTDYREQLDT